MAPDDTRTLDLLKRFHAGDDAALAEMIERDLPWIRRHVQQRLGPKLRARAETMDVVQEAMVHVLRDGPRFVVSDQGKFRALVSAIVENVLRAQHRAQHQQRRDVAREQGIPTSGVLDLDATSPSQAAMRNEDAAWLELGLELMKPTDREIIVLRQWDGLPFVEVGERLGITEDNARVRFNRALARLAPLVKRLRDGELGEILEERSEP